MREAPSLVLLFALSFLNDAFFAGDTIISRAERLMHLLNLFRAGRIDQMIMLMSVFSFFFF